MLDNIAQKSKDSVGRLKKSCACTSYLYRVSIFLMSILNWVKSKRAVLVLIIALTTTVGAQPDTTIAGRSYTLLEAGELMDRLGSANDHSRLALRQTAVQGRLSSLAANLDTVRAALELTDVLFLDEVLLAEVVFLGPVVFSRTTLCG